MALHAGKVEPHARGDYLSALLNRLSRLLSGDHGGRILLSQIDQQLACGTLPLESGTWGFHAGSPANTATSPLNVLLTAALGLVEQAVIVLTALELAGVLWLLLRPFKRDFFGWFACVALATNPLQASHDSHASGRYVPLDPGLLPRAARPPYEHAAVLRQMPGWRSTQCRRRAQDAVWADAL